MRMVLFCGMVKGILILLDTKRGKMNDRRYGLWNICAVSVTKQVFSSRTDHRINNQGKKSLL